MTCEDLRVLIILLVAPQMRSKSKFCDYLQLSHNLIIYHVSVAPDPLKLNQDSRTRFNSLDSGLLLNKPMNIGIANTKASTASDPERTPRPSHFQRSSTPDSLKEACYSPSPAPRPTTPASTLHGFLPPPIPPSSGVREQGSIALRAIRSMRSLARVGNWAQSGATENGVKEVTVKEKKEKKDKEKKERKKDRKEKENKDGTVHDKKDKKQRKEKKERREREKKEKEATLRVSKSSIEAGSLPEGPEQATENAQALGKKKRSILALGLGLPSSIRLPSARSGSTTSSIFLQPNRQTADDFGTKPKERMGSTMSTSSSLRPISMASSSGASAATRESRGSVKWDEEGLKTVKKEIQKEKKEKRKKRKEKEKEQGKDGQRLGDGKRRISITDVFPEVASGQGNDAMDVDQEGNIQKRFSTAFPIATIEETTADGHETETDDIHDSLVYGGIVKEGEKKEVAPQTTPVKRHRTRPMSEQLLGKARPRAVYENEEGQSFVLPCLGLLLNYLQNRSSFNP